MIRLLDDVLTRKPRHPSRYELLFQRAELEREEFDDSRAIRTYQQILAENARFERTDEVRLQLGAALEREGRFVEALAAYSQLVRENSTSRRCWDAHLAMGEIWFEMGRMDLARQSYEKIASRNDYARYKLGWTFINQRDFEAAFRVLSEVATSAGEFAEQAQGDLVLVFAELPDGVAQARSFFLRALPGPRAQERLLRLAQYYDSHDKTSQALELIATMRDVPNPEIRFLHAEILVRQEAFVAAAEQYRLVVAAGPSDRYPREHHDDAAHGRVYALTEALRKAKVEPGASLLALENDLIAASDDFAKLVPKSPQVPSVLLHAAKLLYLRGDLASAAVRLQRVLEMARGAEVAAPARTLLLDCLNRLRDWDALERWARRFLEQRDLSPSVRDDLRDTVARASANAVELLEKQERFDEAAAAMLRIVKEFPNVESAPRNTFNAAVLLERAGHPRSAEPLYEQLRREHPQQEYAARATFALGRMAEARADYDVAAREYERAAAGTVAEVACEALLGTTLLREALGQMEEARLSRRRHSERCVRVEKSDGSVEARFHRAEALFADFEALGLDVAEHRMKAAVSKKKVQMEATIQAYVEVAKSGDLEWSAAAAYRIGLCYRRFVDAVMAVRIPVNLNEEERNAYRAQLQAMVMPLEENAIRSFERAVLLLPRTSYNRWTALSARQLANLPQR